MLSCQVFNLDLIGTVNVELLKYHSGKQGLIMFEGENGCNGFQGYRKYRRIKYQLDFHLKIANFNHRFDHNFGVISFTPDNKC